MGEKKGEEKGNDLPSIVPSDSYALQVMLHYSECGELVIFLLVGVTLCLVVRFLNDNIAFDIMYSTYATKGAIACH